MVYVGNRQLGVPHFFVSGTWTHLRSTIGFGLFIGADARVEVWVDMEQVLLCREKVSCSFLSVSRQFKINKMSSRMSHREVRLCRTWTTMEVVKQEKEVHDMRQEGRRSRSMRVVAV